MDIWSCLSIAKYFLSLKKGCEVHGYDHTIGLKREKTKAEEGFHVWNYGVGPKNGGKIRTLKTLMSMNGHENTPISYLKVRAGTAMLSWEII